MLTETILDIATSTVIICACGVIVVDLLKDIVLTLKKTWDECRSSKKES